MNFYRISELILPTLIQRYDKNSFQFFEPVQKREANFTGCQMPHFIIVLILYINLLNFSWIKQKRSILEEYGAFKQKHVYSTLTRNHAHIITKTRLYNFDPLKRHFYIVKLGFTGVYIIFLISAQKHRLWVLVIVASWRRF